MAPQNNRKVTLALAALIGSTVAVPAAAEVSGNAGVVSKYVFRGVVEDNRTAFQGGLDYEHGSGLYAGTWFSTLNYNDESTDELDDPEANEIDVYGGFSGSAGELGYDIGVLYFAYTGDAADASSVPEGTASLSYGPVSLSANVALDTSNWTAEGDTYVNLGFEQPLPDDFTFSANAGYYMYGGDTEDADGNVSTAKSQDGAFRDATFSLSHPLAAEGSSMHINYTIGGEDRAENGLSNQFWAGAGWTF
jgi:uncharacterized protein (TIGR02001 family)